MREILYPPRVAVSILLSGAEYQNLQNISLQQTHTHKLVMPISNALKSRASKYSKKKYTWNIHKHKHKSSVRAINSAFV